MKQIIAIASSILLIIGCSSTHNTRTPASVDAELRKIGGVYNKDMKRPLNSGRTFREGKLIGDKTVIIRIKTMEEYMRYVDLERVHLSVNESGSMGFFLAAPNVSLPNGVPLTPGYSGETLDAVGYFFTAGAGLSAYGPYSKSKTATYGRTGSSAGWPCGTYDSTPMNETKFSTGFDYKKFNTALVRKFKGDPKAQLRALIASFRMTPMSRGGEGFVQTNCYRKDDGFGWSPLAFDVPSYGGAVQAYAIFRNYKKGDYKKRKADAIDIYGDSFGGHFVWERSTDRRATIKNSTWLINLYKDAGYKYIKY